MNVTLVTAIGGLLVLVLTLELLRRRALREKYAVLWLLVSGTILLFAFAPDSLAWMADTLGIQVPANLVFALGGLVLLGVGMHLSLEVGRLEDRTQRLAEELALLRLEVERGSSRNSEGRRDDDQAAGPAPP